MLLILLGQIIIIQAGGSIFKVQPLGLLDWLIILAATSIVIIKAEVFRFFRRIRKIKAHA
jgi:Ca2+-transporting ATPase